MLDKKGFTLIELMVVILIVAILAAVAIPIMRGRIEAAKWSEGAAIAGKIKTAAKVAYAEDSSAANVTALTAEVSTILTELGFQATDLTGEYFAATDFAITDIDDAGNAEITVTAPSDLIGSAVLCNADSTEGSGWVYDPTPVVP